MKDEEQPTPKPQSSSPPTRPPRGPTVAVGLEDENKPNQEPNRIILPPIRSEKSTIPTITEQKSVHGEQGPKRKIRWVRGAAASVLILLFLAGLIPDLESFNELLIYIAILLVPLACIHFGADRFRFLEFLGWILLFTLFILSTQR